MVPNANFFLVFQGMAKPAITDLLFENCCLLQVKLNIKLSKAERKLHIQVMVLCRFISTSGPFHIVKLLSFDTLL